MRGFGRSLLSFIKKQAQWELISSVPNFKYLAYKHNQFDYLNDLISFKEQLTSPLNKVWYMLCDQFWFDTKKGVLIIIETSTMMRLQERSHN